MAATRPVRLSMATTSDVFRSGEFLRLICAVASNASITLAGLKALNSPVTVVKAVGYDAAGKNTKDLTRTLQVNLGVR